MTTLLINQPGFQWKVVSFFFFVAQVCIHLVGSVGFIACLVEPPLVGKLPASFLWMEKQ